MSGTRDDLVQAIKDAARDYPKETKEGLKQAESEKRQGSK